jgi:hypothetical protein
MPSQLKVEDLVFDEALYPRKYVNMQHVLDLRRANEGGSEFPPIVVCRRTKKIIDGAHRYHVALQTEAKTIAGELRDYQTDADRFKDAVLLNSAQGLRLSTGDQLRVIDMAEAFGLKDIDLASMLRTSMEHLNALKPRYAVADRAFAAAGGNLRKVPLKGSVRHMAGETVSVDQAAALGAAPGASYMLTVRQLKDAIRYELLPPADKHPALWADLRELRDLLNGLLGK